MAADVPDTPRGDGLDRDVIADVLRAQHAELTARLTGLDPDLESLVAASADLNADNEHDPEGRTIAYERAQLSALILAVRDHADTAAAVPRLEQRTYGICEVCGRPITVKRLEARPTTRMCVQHATAADPAGGRTDSTSPRLPGRSIAKRSDDTAPLRTSY